MNINTMEKKVDCPLIINQFIKNINRQEQVGSERAIQLRKKYRQLRDSRMAERLDIIFKMSRTDEELANSLQTFYYT